MNDRPKTLAEVAALVAGASALAAIIIAAGYLALSVPEVQYSHSTGECVRVLPETAGSCDDLPGRYVARHVR